MRVRLSRRFRKAKLNKFSQKVAISLDKLGFLCYNIIVAKGYTKGEYSMKQYHVVAYPYATVEGSISVPDEIEDDDVYDYIREHIDDVSFGEVSLDYAGTDLDISLDDDEDSDE